MKRTAAVFTIVQNEPAFLPIWSQYYRKHVAASDLFVLDHDSTDAITSRVASTCNRVPIHRDESFNHEWLRDVVTQFQAFLLESYELVLFTEIDEIVAPNPGTWPDGLGAYLESIVLPDAGFIRCTGYEIVHRNDEGEPALDWNRPIIEQRSSCRRSERYSKPLLGSRSLSWKIGYHQLEPRHGRMPPPDPELLLLHLHRVDYAACRAKTQENASRRWAAADFAARTGYQNRIVDKNEFDRWFYTDYHDDLYNVEPIRDGWEVIV